MMEVVMGIKYVVDLLVIVIIVGLIGKFDKFINFIVV